MADKRFRASSDDYDARLAKRNELYEALLGGSLTVGEAVVQMRQYSRLTQVEFARHRGISVQALRQIERGQGNPTLETLEKIAEVFTLRVGFVRMSQDQAQLRWETAQREKRAARKSSV